jgi:predicted metalloendopeptidase
VDQSLPWIASKFFLDEAYTEETREELEKMTADIETAYLKRVTGFDWISNSTVSIDPCEWYVVHQLTSCSYL